MRQYQIIQLMCKLEPHKLLYITKLIFIDLLTYIIIKLLQWSKENDPN